MIEELYHIKKCKNENKGNFDNLPSLIKNQFLLRRQIRNIFIKNRSKYDFSSMTFFKMQMTQMFNNKSTLYGRYIEMLLIIDPFEFVKNYYLTKQSVKALPQLISNLDSNYIFVPNYLPLGRMYLKILHWLNQRQKLVFNISNNHERDIYINDHNIYEPITNLSHSIPLNNESKEDNLAFHPQHNDSSSDISFIIEEKHIKKTHESIDSIYDFAQYISRLENEKGKEEEKDIPIEEEKDILIENENDIEKEMGREIEIETETEIDKDILMEKENDALLEKEKKIRMEKERKKERDRQRKRERHIPHIPIINKITTNQSQRRILKSKNKNELNCHQLSTIEALKRNIKKIKINKILTKESFNKQDTNTKFIPTEVFIDNLKKKQKRVFSFDKEIKELEKRLMNYTSRTNISKSNTSKRSLINETTKTVMKSKLSIYPYLNKSNNKTKSKNMKVNTVSQYFKVKTVPRQKKCFSESNTILSSPTTVCLSSRKKNSIITVNSTKKILPQTLKKPNPSNNFYFITNLTPVKRYILARKGKDKF